MAKRNAQEAYQRVQEAKAKSRTRSGGARAITSPPPPPPPPKNTGTPSQPIVISSSIVIDGAIVYPPAPEVVSESDLKTRGQRIIESPPHSKDAPTSSSVPPTGPGGAPPEPSGGDSSTPLKK
ncbi:increased rDNA silencing protein 4-like [Arachis stenosperma]|uniref:increased rDNA silencing protein 4-like n=1 Tax=Arachis stenosperma TaxID=217475 RepID=UPI0025ABDA1E|nr:increased rDNA silencing protein 4-like [Arachis stenosperma]